MCRKVCWQSSYQTEEEYVEGPKYGSSSQETEREEETWSAMMFLSCISSFDVRIVQMFPFELKQFERS